MKKILGWMIPFILLGFVTVGYSQNVLTTPYNHYNDSLFILVDGNATVTGDEMSGYQLVLKNPDNSLKWFTDCYTHRSGMMSNSSLFDAWSHSSGAVRTTIRIDHGNVAVVNLRLVSWDGNQAVFDMDYVGNCTLSDTQGHAELNLNGSNILFPIPEGYVFDNPSCNPESVYGCS